MLHWINVLLHRLVGTAQPVEPVELVSEAVLLQYLRTPLCEISSPLSAEKRESYQTKRTIFQYLASFAAVSDIFAPATFQEGAEKYFFKVEVCGLLVEN